MGFREEGPRTSTGEVNGKGGWGGESLPASLRAWVRLPPPVTRNPLPHPSSHLHPPSTPNRTPNSNSNRKHAPLPASLRVWVHPPPPYTQNPPTSSFLPPPSSLNPKSRNLNRTHEPLPASLRAWVRLPPSRRDTLQPADSCLGFGVWGMG